MVRLTVVLSAPALVSVALTVRVDVPDAVGVPMMAMLPLPLWVAVRPAGKPVTPALLSATLALIIRLAA